MLACNGMLIQVMKTKNISCLTFSNMLAYHEHVGCFGFTSHVRLPTTVIVIPSYIFYLQLKENLLLQTDHFLYSLNTLY